jgi:hypothetical protein
LYSASLPAKSCNPATNGCAGANQTPRRLPLPPQAPDSHRGFVTLS